MATKESNNNLDLTNASLSEAIVLQGVRTNNLKDIDITIPKNKIVTVTGVSGSGKSSLAFGTIYKEGQFRYIESLSSYLRQFFSLGTRPEIDYSSGLSPAIAIEQNKRVGNVRSTVGTLTEIDDYLRLLMAKVGTVFCYACGKPLKPKTTEQIVNDIKARYEHSKVYLLQELKVINDAQDLARRSRRNKKQVDQGGGFTRFLVGYNWDVKEKTFSDTVEYFYLEEPVVPKHLFPVMIYGIFDRVTINDSTLKRLKDDSIKMLGRADKFGVMIMDEEKVEVNSKSVEGDSKNVQIVGEEKEAAQPEFLVNSSMEISDGRKQSLIDHTHTKDGFINRARALVRNEKGEILGLFDTRFGHYQLPGGKVDTGEILEEGMRREVEEEIGAKVVSAERVGSTKVFFSLGGTYTTLYDVTIKGEPTIMEPEKFSHTGRCTVKNSKNNVLKKKIIIGDEELDSWESIVDGGMYWVWLVESGQLEKINNAEEYVVSLPHRDEIVKDAPYCFYADTKSKTYKFVQQDSFKQTKTRVLVYMTTGEKILQGYEAMFGSVKKAGKPKDTSHLPPIIRYTDKCYCAQDNISYPDFTTQHFSSNRQEGACPQCHGLGEELQVDLEKVLDVHSPYLQAILPWRDSRLGQAILKKLAHNYKVDENAIWGEMPDWFTQIVLEGDEELLKLNTGGGKYVSMYYKGIEDVIKDQYNKGILTVDFQAMLDLNPCSMCDGAKLRPESLHVYLVPEDLADREELASEDELTEKYNIFDLQKMTIEELVSFFERYRESTNSPDVLINRILTPLIERATMIVSLGLGYMNTARRIDSLSGGEIQRLRLAKQLGNKLTGIIYVLDEPTIGLDEKEILKVIAAVTQLKENGNTIIVVEHNEAFIKASDWIVETGPGAGDFGGHVEFSGPYKDFIKTDTLTAQYITGKKKIEATFDHKPSNISLNIRKATKHNLQGINVAIDLGSFTIITGSSGAGKTTLMYYTLFEFLENKQKFIQSHIRLKLLKKGLSWAEIIQAPIMRREEYEHLENLAVQEFYNHIGVESISGYEEIENVMYVNQSSIGKTPRSCPATFVGVFDDIRKLYAGAVESKMLGFNTGHFSFNSSKGACPECRGYGHKKVELQFLPDTYVPCELCNGRRYKPEILDIKWHDKTISQILDMYVEDAYEFFIDMPFIKNKLQLMMDIGLGYLKMGQPAHTLSGGESQRLKLVKHLLKSYRGHTVYFLDEPTVGLHPSDITRLLKVLKRFLDNGDTILMIEHEQSLLQFADQVIRLEKGKLKSKKKLV